MKHAPTTAVRCVASRVVVRQIFFSGPVVFSLRFAARDQHKLSLRFAARNHHKHQQQPPREIVRVQYNILEGFDRKDGILLLSTSEKTRESPQPPLMMCISSMELRTLPPASQQSSVVRPSNAFGCVYVYTFENGGKRMRATRYRARDVFLSPIMLHSVNIHSVGSTKKVRSCLQLSSDRMQNTAATCDSKQARVVEHSG